MYDFSVNRLTVGTKMELTFFFFRDYISSKIILEIKIEIGPKYRDQNCIFTYIIFSAKKKKNIYIYIYICNIYKSIDIDGFVT